MNPRNFFEKLVKVMHLKGASSEKQATGEAIKHIVVGDVKAKKAHWQGAKSGQASGSKVRKRLRKIQKASRKRNRDA